MMSDNSLPEGSIPLAESMPLNAAKPNQHKVAFQPVVPIEIELPDGRIISMAKPNISLSESIANVLASINYRSSELMEVEQKRVKMLMHITHIDGLQEPRIADPIMRAALEQKIGDEYMDALFVTWAMNFPQYDPSVLKVVKKS